jgi:hypothetical protein
MGRARTPLLRKPALDLLLMLEEVSEGETYQIKQLRAFGTGRGKPRHLRMAPPFYAQEALRSAAVYGGVSCPDAKVHTQC